MATTSKTNMGSVKHYNSPVFPVILVSTLIMLSVISSCTIVDSVNTPYQIASQVLSGISIFWAGMILVFVPWIVNRRDSIIEYRYWKLLLPILFVLVCSGLTVYKNTHQIDDDDFVIAKNIVGGTGVSISLLVGGKELHDILTGRWSRV